MKLTIERAALLKALSHVQSVVERRTTIPILSNVLLRAEAGQLALSATDMDLEIVERVAARVERDGRTTAPAHTLYDIVRKLRDGAQVEMETSGGRNEMVLRSGRSTFTLACLPPEDYPVMSAGELPHHFALSAAELRTLIDRTRFAISTEETRYYLNGIYLHATKSNEVPVVRAVATDGHRLARVEMTAPEGAAGMPGIIVPRKTVLELRKLVEEGDEEVQIALGETKIRVRRRRGGADLEADRRHLPRLRPGDPGRQRQGPRGRRARSSPRRSTASRRSRPSAAARSSSAIERGSADGLGDQPGKRHRGRGAGGALPRARRSRSASTRAICSTSPSRSAARTCSSRWPMPARRRSCATARRRPRRSALYVLMPMRV